MGRFVILSGPSCVGKSPLHVTLTKFHPELADNLHPLVLFNSRAPRPHEQDGGDYHFRPREEIEQLRNDNDYLVMDVRGDLQALSFSDLRNTLKKGDALFEGNPFIGRALVECPLNDDVERLTMFMAPLSREELIELKDPARKVNLPDFVTSVMRRKLLRRTQRQNTILSLKDLENIEKRAGSAYRELKEACHFQYVIPNHDGEDSENWTAFYYPIGDARKALNAVVSLLKGENTDHVEKWEPDLLP